MIVRVIDPPDPIVSWLDAQRHLRLDGDDEKAYVEGLIAAATSWIDGPSGWLGRAVGEQTLELADCGFGNDRLPYPPIVTVESITYLGSDGLDHEMAEGDFIQLLNGSIAPLLGQSWPSVGDSPEAVRVRYVAGYPVTDADPSVSTVPAAITQAILLLIGHWYRNRETVVTGTIATSLPLAVEALLSTYRVWR